MCCLLLYMDCGYKWIEVSRELSWGSMCSTILMSWVAIWTAWPLENQCASFQALHLIVRIWTLVIYYTEGAMHQPPDSLTLSVAWLRTHIKLKELFEEPREPFEHFNPFPPCTGSKMALQETPVKYGHVDPLVLSMTSPHVHLNNKHLLLF